MLVINPAVSFEELLRFILTDLGRPPTPGTTKLQMTEALNAELLDTLARGGNVVVLIDEAQDLTIPVLEELRLLSNLETAKEKILQFVLAGQPEFESMLARPEIRQLRQRIAVNARLRPLGRGEVKAYVAARIAAAGGDERGLFRPTALYRLWRFSSGVPRLVNVACDNALVTAYAAGKRTVGWKAMGEATRDLAPGPHAGGRRLGVPAFRLGTIAVAAILGAGGAYAVSRLTAEPTAQTPPPVPAVAPAPEAPRVARAVPPPVAPPRAVAPPTVERDDHRAPEAAVRYAAPGTETHAGGEAPAERPRAELSAPGVPPRVAVAPPPVSDVPAAESPALPEPRRLPPAVGRRPDGSAAAPPATGYGTAGDGWAAAAPSGGRPETPDAEPAPVGARDGGPSAYRAARGGEPSTYGAAPETTREVAPADSAVGVGDRSPAGAVRYVRVERGDTITAIAHAHYGYVTPEILAAIKRANPDLRDLDVIMVGGTLALPASGRVVDRPSGHP